MDLEVYLESVKRFDQRTKVVAKHVVLGQECEVTGLFAGTHGFSRLPGSPHEPRMLLRNVRTGELFANVRVADLTEMSYFKPEPSDDLDATVINTVNTYLGGFVGPYRPFHIRVAEKLGYALGTFLRAFKSREKKPETKKSA